MGFGQKSGILKHMLFPEYYAEAHVSGVKSFPKDEPKIRNFGAGFEGFADTVYAVEEGGVIRSACVAVRQNTECAEAWVFTAPEDRRRGLAQMVVTAWAQGQMKEGRVPFYSHRIANVASAKVAERLGLISVFEEVGIETKAE
jgi:predicted GNAT family acetyltransferase